MQESSRLRFDLCYWGTLAVLSIGTGVFRIPSGMEPDSGQLSVGLHRRHLRCGRVLPNVAKQQALLMCLTHVTPAHV